MYHYPFHLRDYLAKTRHLSLLEDLSYRRLLDAYYTREAPLPACPADCARLICMRDQTEEVEAVLREFFELTESGWTNARCEEELLRYHGMKDKLQKANVKRWNAEKAKAKAEKPKAEGFDEFIALYPRKTAVKTARDAWNALCPDEDLRKRIADDVQARAQSADWKRERGQFVPHPATYIRQRRWEDAPAPSFWTAVEEWEQ